MNLARAIRWGLVRTDSEATKSGFTVYVRLTWLGRAFCWAMGR